MKTEELYHDISNVLADKKLHSVSELCMCGKYTAVEVKELLIKLLKDRSVQCKGNRWRLLHELPDIKREDTQGENVQNEYFVICPACHNFLSIEEDFIGMKAECPFCNTAFIISSEKDGTNGYKTVLQKQV